MKKDLDRGLIQFFEVEKCGLYRKRDNKSEYVKGDMSSSLGQITNWLKDRDFDDTIPWDIEHNQNRKKLHCLNEYTDNETGDVVLVFWESFSDDSGYLKGVSSGGKFGSDAEKSSIQITTPSKDGKRSLLGRPLYYWFIPEIGVVASIKFPHSLASTQLICDYIKKCIDYRVDIPGKKIKETTYFNERLQRDITQKIVEYPDLESDGSLRYYFSASMKEISNKQINYKNLSNQITHIAVKDVISTKLEIPVTSGFEAYDLVKGKSHNNRLFKSVQIVEEAKVTESELRNMVEIFFDQYDGHDEVDLGFKTDTSNAPPKWFSSYKKSEVIFLNSLKTNTSYHHPLSLMNEIKKLRYSIIEELNTSIIVDEVI